MRRRRGQSGGVFRRGKVWKVRFYCDVPGQEERVRRSVPVGPAQGEGRLTKAEAIRKAREIVESYGVNTAAHLERALNPQAVQTVRDRVAWCRQFHRAWNGRPGSVASLESHLEKHVLPRLGDLPIDAITETKVMEFVAELGRAVFERKRKDGSVVKAYRLSRKTLANVVGALKLILGRKVWMTWELDLGRVPRARQRYFTEADMARIIEAAEGQLKVLFAVCSATGMRISECVGLKVEDVGLEDGVIYVRSGKTENAARAIDVDAALVGMLKEHIGERTSGVLFPSGKSTQLDPGNLRRRWLAPLLKRLGLAHAGFHAARHGRVTVLRKAGVAPDLQKQWIGHSSLRTGDRYSHTSEEVEFRKAAAEQVGLGRIVGPNGPHKASGEAA